MSTFKVQPIYAELLMGWLDMAHMEVADMTFHDVLSTVSWNFKGGKLGDYDMRFPTECSQTRFPAGRSEVIATADDADVNLIALKALVRRRVTDKRKRARSCADWAASFSLAKAMQRLMCTSEPVITGMRAVYMVLRDVWSNCSVPSRSDAARRLMTFVRECTMASSAASFLDLEVTNEVCNAVFSALSFTRMAALRHAAADFKRVVRHSGSRAARQTAIRRGRQVMSDPDMAKSAELGELGATRFNVAARAYYVGHGCATTTVRGHVLVLSRSDILRIHQFLTGAQSGLFATVSQACVAPGPERLRAVEIGRVYESQVSLLLETAHDIPQGDEVLICKAYKRAFGAYLGELAGPLCAAETRELWDEARGTKWAGKLQLDAWVEAIRPWTASTAFNLGKVYKLCPAPDASPGLTMIERHEMVCNHNEVDPSIMPLFESELRSQVLRAYIRSPGVRLGHKGVEPPWWGAYRAGDLDAVPSDDIHTYLAWEGTAVMPARSPDNPAVWKDSGLGWDSYDEAVDPDRPQKHGNMLMRMVFDKSVPMPGTRHAGHAHDHKVDIKPEGHKDPARGIYSGNIRDRLNQSWMEAAVQDVARHHPAFMIGANSEAREARIRALVDRPHDPWLIALYYSFDVAGWSPRMPPEPQHISHNVWGMLYGESLFHEAHHITDGVRVYMNKQGYTGWFENPGANFEGYNGKEMTMILITLMSLTVRLWRAKVVQAGLATEDEARRWSALLLAYIDDGLTKMLLPSDRAERLFQVFKDTTVETFARCGYTIEMSKCYPSDRFAVFLNEPYLCGRHITHGTRAAMTICAENTEEHTSLIERLTSVSTGCRGAVMAGLDATAGVMLQAYHVFEHLSEWIHRPDPVACAVWAHTPRAWGGLGMPTALQLGTSGSGSAFEESVRTLQRWAHVSTPAKRVFLVRARGRLTDRTSTGVLLAPLGGRTADGTMVESRVPDAVRGALSRLRSTGLLTSLATDFLGYASPESLDCYASMVVPLRSGSIIQEQLLTDLSAAHPHAIFSAFARRIEKSTTLMQLVGQREMHRIMRANREDAARSYQCLISILMVR